MPRLSLIHILDQHADNLDTELGPRVLDLLGRDGGDRHQTAARLDAGQRRLAALAPHQIQHQIEQTIGDRFGAPPGLVVIHHPARPETMKEAVIVAACRGNHMGTIGAVSYTHLYLISEA